jgi:hypothetical protein
VGYGGEKLSWVLAAKGYSVFLRGNIIVGKSCSEFWAGKSHSKF